jgi:hypothetical protein
MGALEALEASAVLEEIIREFSIIFGEDETSDPGAPGGRAGGCPPAILGHILAGLVAGAGSFCLLKRNYRHCEVLKGLLPDREDVPGAPWLARMVYRTDPVRLASVFERFAPEFHRRVSAVRPEGDVLPPDHVFLHGASRRALKEEPGGKAFVVNAASGLATLAVVRVPGGGQGARLEAYSKAVDILAVRGLVAGRLLGVDAQGSLAGIPARIGSHGGDFLLPVSPAPAGRPGLGGALDAIFGGRAIPGAAITETALPPDNVRGRPISRRIALAEIPSAAVLGPAGRGWDGLRSLLRIDVDLGPGRGGAAAAQARRYYATSLRMPPERLMEIAAAFRRAFIAHSAIDNPMSERAREFAVIDPFDHRAARATFESRGGRGFSFRLADPGVLEFWSVMRKLAQNFLAPIRSLNDGSCSQYEKDWLINDIPHLHEAILTADPEEVGTLDDWRRRRDEWLAANPSLATPPGRRPGLLSDEDDDDDDDGSEEDEGDFGDDDDEEIGEDDDGDYDDDDDDEDRYGDDDEEEEADDGYDFDDGDGAADGGYEFDDDEDD